MTTLTLGTNSDPLQISVSGQTEFLDLLFSSNSRSMKCWMVTSVALGGNSFNNGFTVGSTSFTSVYYGKSFPAYPWVMGLWGSNSLFSISWFPNSGLRGWFMHAHSSQVTIANCNNYSDTAWVAVFDHNATG